MASDENPIPPVTRDDPAAHSGAVVGENVAALKALFPSIVTDGKVDFDVLRQLLGDEVEEGAERYGLNWKGKARARAFALTPSLGTLRPAKVDGKDWDNTRNILIEGDNLEVLKLLRKSYAGKVKLIYIDPPYNTGKDFVYPDNYTDSLARYEALTGQRGEDGARMTSNKEASGRFHTDWLNMMYPRLMLAKELLREDGVIGISCDDNEVDNLRCFMREIFGDDGLISQIVVQSNKRGQTYKDIAKTHEYIIVSSRSDDFVLYEADKADGSLPFTDTTGDFDMWELRNRNPKFGKHNRPNLFYPIYVNPNLTDESGYNLVSTVETQGYDIPTLPLNSDRQESCWRWGKEKLIAENAKNGPPVVVARQTRDGHWNVYQKSRRSTTKVKSLWTDNDVISEQGTVEVGKLGMGDTFDHPKPIALVKNCVALGTTDDDLVLDFFAGSGTTGHAVMAQNAADGGNRRYILVQLPEPLDPAKAEQKTAADFCDTLGKPRTIAELTKERLRRAGEKVKADNPDADIDTGFRVYKLSSSNLKPWSPGDDLAADLLDAAGNILPGRSEEDLLVELLLKTGIDLTLPAETREIAGCTVHCMGGGTLIVCLSDIPADKARALGDGIADWLAEVAPPAPTTLFFKDSGFDPGGERKAEARSNLAATLRQRLGKDAIEKLGAI